MEKKMKAKRITKLKRNRILAQLEHGDKPSLVATKNKVKPYVVYNLSSQIKKGITLRKKTKKKASVKKRVSTKKFVSPKVSVVPTKDVLRYGTKEEKRMLLIQLLAEDVILND